MASGFKREFQLMEERKELLIRKKFEEIEAERSRIDQKAKIRLIDRRMHMERLEAEMEEKLVRAKEAELIRAAQVEQEEKLASEMKRIQHQEAVKLKLRQKLRESSQELRELESKLKAAYVTKELTAQLAEKELIKMEEKLQEQKVYEMLEEERQRAEEKRRQNLTSSKSKKLEYRHQLQEQIIDAYKKQQEAYQEFLKEKALLDDVVRLIHEEDQREEEIKMIKMKKTKQELEEFCKMRDIWRQKLKADIEEEDRRINEFLQQRQKEERIKMEEARRKEETKTKVHEILAHAMTEKAKEKLEKEDIRLELIELEKKEMDEKKRREEIEKTLRSRLELKNCYKQQFLERWTKLKEEEEQEAVYKQKLLEKFAEDQRLDQMTAERRKMKMLQYKEELTTLLEERHKKRLEEMHELMALEEAEKKEEAKRRKLIEEERLRMLKQHASKLIGYLPRGLLRDDDFVQLGENFTEEYNKFRSVNTPSCQ
uniref:Meiosis-specific nuclear structural protein 1 n=1 Tax=Clastoptera arizonana TaxID=38151 RepID=A0A1B6CBQ1_9HEMI